MSLDVGSGLPGGSANASHAAISQTGLPQKIRCGIVSIVGLITLAGCGKASTDSIEPPAVSQVVPTVSSEPGEIELTEAVARMDGFDMVKFEVKYKFTKGVSDKFYRLEICFPGTTNKAMKDMDDWEVNETGVIRDSLNIYEKPVKDFEITISEAFRPDQGYKLISNKITGTVLEK